MNEPTPKRHVLLVDDDTVILTLLSQVFENEGFSVSAADSAKGLRAALVENPPDLVVLDINLPDESGFVLAQEIRGKTQAGIIMLTSRREDVDRLIGLELGADDYLTKPFNERELVVRARNLLRRVPIASTPVDNLRRTSCRFGDWRFFPLQHRLEQDGAQVLLTRAESVLLSALVGRPGTVLSRQQLREAIHGGGGGESGDRTIDVLILRLRRKLNDDPRAPQLISTVPSIGYYFSSPVASDN